MYKIAALCLVCALGQRVAAGDWAQCAADLLVLLDASGSVVDEFKHEVDMLRAFAAGLPDVTTKFRVALIVYHNSGRKNKALWSYYDWSKFGTKAAFVQRVAGIRHDGVNHGTDTGAAIEDAIKMFKKRRQTGTPPIMVVITDGSTADMDRVRTAMATVKQMGIKAIAVGVNKWVKKANLHEHANPSSQVVINGDTKAAAEEALGMVTSLAHCAAPAPPPPAATCAADLLVLLDASGSVVDEFKHEVDMLRAFAAGLPDVTTKFRLALVIYHAFWQKKLWSYEDWTQFGTKADFVQRVAGIRHDGGNHATSTGSAIEDAIEMFKKRRQTDGRPIMVVITDGDTDMDRVRTAMATVKQMQIQTVAVGVNTIVKKANLHEHANPTSQVVINRDGKAAAEEALGMVKTLAHCAGKE